MEIKVSLLCQIDNFETIGNVLGIDVYSRKIIFVIVIVTQGYLGAIGAFLKGADTLKTEQYSWQVLCVLYSWQVLCVLYS